MNTPLKQCSKCREHKPFTDFHKNRTKHDGVNSYCKECMGQYSKHHAPEYKQKPEVKERMRRYNREYSKRPHVAKKVRSSHRHYYRSPEQRKKNQERHKRYAKDPKKKAAEKKRMKAYRQRPDVKRRNRRYVKNRYHENIEQAREYGRLIAMRRYARQQKAPGKHTIEEFRTMCHLVDKTCASCGPKTRLQRDHIIPLIKNGCDCIHNIQPLCRSCNSAKKDYHATDYRPQCVLDWLGLLPIINYRCPIHILMAIPK